MKWSRAMLLFFALAAHAEIFTLDHLGVEAQERTTWCWAAVSAMAIRSFPPQGDFQPLTQLQVVARRKVGAEKLPVTDAMKAAIVAAEKTCAKPDKCGAPQEPLLFDIQSNFLAPHTALSMQALTMDIKGRGHPVIIRWFYSATSATSTKVPLSAHALIITGYDDGPAKRVRVFNPLPVGSTDITKHEQWIPYARYLDPGVDEGVTVTALHYGDQYRMRRSEEQTQPRGDDEYPKVEVSRVSAPNLPPGGFEAPATLEPAISQYMKGWVFWNRDGSPRRAPLSTGKPIPIVAIRGDELIQAGAHPEALLVRRTAAYIVPVLEGTEVVDSFQLLHENDRWQEGGYSNNQIASLAVVLREKNAGQFPKTEEFYVVSIPEASSFFVAHGFQDQAKLNSVDYEGGGGFIPANQALSEVVGKLREFADDKGDGSQIVTPPTHSPR